jgi:hypothetical protein
MDSWMTPIPFTRVRSKLARIRDNQKLKNFSEKIYTQAGNCASESPILFFNASTRLEQVSQNAAFSLLSAWSLALDRHPVRFFTCHAGLTRCLLGTFPDQPDRKPPCYSCYAQSKKMYQAPWLIPFTFTPDVSIDHEINKLNLAGLNQFTHRELPLGEIVLPSLRWILRRHNLTDDETTRAIYMDFLHSASSLASVFEETIRDLHPATIVVFNGQFFPEATVKNLARKHGIRVISHEVALQPLSAFFTDGEATAYPIHIPKDSRLTSEQDKRLDGVLEKRFQGDFSMAGIKFWGGMKPFDDSFWKKVDTFEQIVPVFTNVIFDTSQAHANSIYPDMFCWLEEISGLIKENPRTLFVIRAHPDEIRPGKESRETVSEWVKSRGLNRLPNVVLIEPGDNLSSYQLIQRSKFVMVYNSTIGLEASILGAAVICAGRARFTQVKSVFLPASRFDHQHMAQEFLQAERIEIPGEFRLNARYFLHYQLFRTSLPFDEFLEESETWKGYVKLKDFPLENLKAENSLTMRIIQNGILEGTDFIFPD